MEATPADCFGQFVAGKAARPVYSEEEERDAIAELDALTRRADEREMEAIRAEKLKAEAAEPTDVPLREPKDDSEPARPAKVEEYLKSIPDRPHFPHLSSDHSNRMREGIALENSGRSDDFEKSLALMTKFEKDFTLACRGHMDEEETGKLWDSLFNMTCREFFTICPELDRYDWLKENPEHGTKPAKQKKAGKSISGKPKYWKAARRVARSEETWRILDNYPNYEISSHGRVRSLSRARPDDWLKPRRRWQYGYCVASVVLFDKDHVRRERDIGWLLVAAGFVKKPKWAGQKSL